MVCLLEKRKTKQVLLSLQTVLLCSLKASEEQFLSLLALLVLLLLHSDVSSISSSGAEHCVEVWCSYFKQLFQILSLQIADVILSKCAKLQKKNVGKCITSYVTALFGLVHIKLRQLWLDPCCCWVKYQKHFGLYWLYWDILCLDRVCTHYD